MADPIIYVSAVRKILVTVLVIGIVVYARLMALDVLPSFELVHALFKRASPGYMYALPICAISAFGIVALLNVLATPSGALGAAEMEIDLDPGRLCIKRILDPFLESEREAGTLARLE